MKKLSMVKLSRQELSHVEIQGATVLGGIQTWKWTFPDDGPDVICGCNCLYADTGGSSIENNGLANKKDFLHSPEEP